jgi:hypothetical protein
VGPSSIDPAEDSEDVIDWPSFDWEGPFCDNGWDILEYLEE